MFTIYKDKASGKASAARPRIDECLADLRKGEVLVVWRFDRLGRSLPDFGRIVSELEQERCGPRKLGRADRDELCIGRQIYSFLCFAALAEFERNLIRERTKGG